ncbi:MAG: HesA/MoeB/ThiF family protein [Defluviitaleaceae bacterium]|nr:HesA/MoeB/ThiF family protein [Defluviitaleaceae bacterium]
MTNERDKRYDRNGKSVTPADNEILAVKKVCVIGCGGLGGYIAEMLLRVGVLNLTLIDNDVFDETNLNRQLFSTEGNLGKPKVFEAERRLMSVDSKAKLRPLHTRLDAANAGELLGGHDAVVDALDNIESRRIAAEACGKLGIPYVHGAIGGWSAQVSVIMPGGEGLAPLYGNLTDKDVDKSWGNLPFVAGFTACMQCAEVVKLLLGKSPNLQGSVARADLMYYDFNVF